MEEATLTLYHDTTSYYSQKVRLVLAEKGIPYKSELLAMKEFANVEPWYMCIHPKGQVPALGTGSGYVPDSNKIIEYLERTYPEKPLLPTDESPRSQMERQLHQDLDKLVIPVLTLGSFTHPDLTDGCLLPAETIRTMIARFGDGREEKILQRLAEENPDLREVYQQKLADVRLRSGGVPRAAVEGQINSVTQILTGMEKFLAQNVTAYQSSTGRQVPALDRNMRMDRGIQGTRGTGPPNVGLVSKELEPWVGGSRFGLADILLTITLVRLKVIGLSRGLWGSGQRPHLAKYFTNALQRPSVKQNCLFAWGVQVK